MFPTGRKRASEAMNRENPEMEDKENQPLVSGPDEMDVIDEEVIEFIYRLFVRNTDRDDVSCLMSLLPTAGNVKIYL